MSNGWNWIMFDKKTAKWSIALIFSYLFNYISMHNILKNSKKSTVTQFPPQKGLAASFMIEALQRFVMWHTGGATLDFTDDKSTLLQGMAWCCQATSHCLSQCWPSSLLPYGVTRNDRKYRYIFMLPRMWLAWQKLTPCPLMTQWYVSNFYPQEVISLSMSVCLSVRLSVCP